ncbi:MAG: nitronate monooxygenase [Rhodospirillaceae bacterium]
MGARQRSKTLEVSLKALRPLLISGREVLPLVEGGKGISVSIGKCSGAWAAAGGVGTFSGVNADSRDENGELEIQLYHTKTRRERHEELIVHSIRGGIYQAQVAHEVSNGCGRIHMNVLWEMGGCERILNGILDGARGLIHGVTCGAGMPFRVAEITAQFGCYYYPIVSSARAFRALWLRAYSKHRENLGGVVYEDPWLAGGHNGLSNSEDPRRPEDPLPRVMALRAMLNSFGMTSTPIIMAGGVWYLRDWDEWLDNPEVGPIAFQFGTRPLLTQESPISASWKRKLLTLKEGDVFLNNFSPTGFYSSAVNNNFIQELRARCERQVPFQTGPVGMHDAVFPVGQRGRPVYLTSAGRARALVWVAEGFTVVLKSPDDTLVFCTPEKAEQILQDQVSCMGCLSGCRFSNWAQNEQGTTNKKADPRSYCIQKALQAVSHTDDCENQLVFSGHNAFKFASDPFYANGFVPTVRQLVERICSGD